MDCNENAAPTHTIPNTRGWNEVTASSSGLPGQQSQTRPCCLDNGVSNATDQQANVPCLDDNSPSPNGLLTWKDLSPSHKKYSTGETCNGVETAPSSDEDKQPVLITWGKKSSSGELSDDPNQPHSLLTWKNISPTRLSKNAFGFSSPDSSDSDTVRHYTVNGTASAPPMQESSSDTSVGTCSPTHGARGGSGSDGSTYLPSPEDGFSNEYFYDEDFSVKFDSNLKDSLVETVPSEGVSTPSILEFSDTMTIDVNQASSTIDGSFRRSRYDSEISVSDHRSCDLSPSDRGMMCSSDVLQISDGPLFTPTPTNEFPPAISTDSLDRGSKGLTASTSTSETAKTIVDCGTKKELYMLSFFNHKGKQTTSLASVASQASWSSEQQLSRSNSNCTSQEDLDGSVSASLQTHFSFNRGGNSLTRKPSSGKCGPAPSRSRSEGSGIARRHLSTATSTESVDATDVDPNSERSGRLTSWKTVKQRRKVTGQNPQTSSPKPKSKSMPDLYMQNWLDKMAGCAETQTDSQDADVEQTCSSAEQLKGSATSLVELYHKMRPDRFSDQNLSEDSVSVSTQSKDSVFSDCDTGRNIAEVKDSNSQTAASLPFRTTAIPPRFYTYSSESETSADCRHRKTCHSLERRRTGAVTSPQHSEPGGYSRQTLPRAYKRSVSSPGRCGHACSSGDTEKQTQCPSQFAPERVIVWRGTKNFSAQFPPNTRDCGIQTAPDNQKQHNLTDREMQTSPDKPSQPFGSMQGEDGESSEVFYAHQGQTSPTRLSRSANVRRPVDDETFPKRFPLLRPHSIGAIGEEDERRFPTYDAVVSRCAVREKRGASLSPNRSDKQSFYSHRSLPDLSFLTTHSPKTSPVQPMPPDEDPETQTEPDLEAHTQGQTNPVFYLPKLGTSHSHSAMSSAGAVRKIPQNFHPFVAHHHHTACAHQGRQADAEQNHQTHHRHGRMGRGEPGRKNSSGHAPHSASSSSGFSTSSTSSGIDPGYHDNRRSPPMAEQFAHGYQAWDSRHKYVETDGGCVYYHSLPNHLPPGFISEEEKMDYYACMCIKPSVQETKMYAYKYERYPESHQHYLPSKSRPHPMDGPAQDGGQELIPEEQSTSSGMGKSDDIFSVHENDQSSSPDEGSRHESHSEEFCRVVPSAPPFNELASNGVVLRRGKNWHHGNHSSETGSSDNLSGGTSSGSSGDDRKPLKSCLRRRRLERRCKSMSLTDPFRLFEGYINPGPRRSPNHRHSYGCDGYPLYMDYLYDAMENSQLGEMMEWYRATYLHDVQLPAGACPCSCSAVPGVPSRQELLVSTDEPASSGDVSGTTTTTTTADVNQTSEGNPDDSMEKREKRKSVSFASEVSFHSPLPSPQCSPKHRQGGNATTTTTQQAPSVSQQNKGGNWDSTPNTKPGLPVPQLRTNTTSDEDTDDACSDVAPSEFNVTSPRGLSDSHGRDSITACMDKKKVYMSDVCRAAESLVAHFSQSKGTFDKLRLGSCLDTPEVGHLVLSQLCPAIARIISDGLKAYTGGLHVFGRIQITVWRVAEVSAELGPSTRAVHELVKDLRNRSDLVSTRQKFEAFVFGLLNLRLLDFWMGYTRHKDKVVDKLYEADSIMCMSHNSLQQAYEDMLASLQPLAILPFQLDASFIVALHMSRGKSENSMVENLGEKLSGETTAMKQSQPSTSAKTSWSWLGGSVSNTLPRAKSLVSKLHSGAVRSLTMFSSGSSTSSVPITASQDQLDQCLPRNKGGELYISESKIESLDSSASESSRVISPHQNGQILLNLRQETSDEDSQTESSHGMSKFAAKIFNMAAGKLEKVGPVYRQGMTQYYFEGESSEGGATPKLLTPGTDTSTSGSSAQSPVLTWGEVKKSGKDIKTDGVIPPPKPPRVLQEGKPCLSSTPSTLSEAKIANQKASSPTKPKQQFGLIKLFDRLLLPSSSSKQQQQITEEKPRKRWSWAPLGSKETVQNSESEGVDKRYGSVTTFKGIGVESAHIQTSSSNIEIQKNCEERDTEKTAESESSVEKVKTVIDKKAEAEKLANQITLQDGPVLMLPPKKVVPESGCYSGIVQSDKLTLSVTSEADTQQSFSHVDSNANFVNTTVDQVPVNSCSGASNGQGQTGQSAPPAQSSNQHQSTSASHVPTSSSHQHRSVARGESSSDSDQSKSSTPTDQSESSTQPAVAMTTRTDEFKLPDYRYVEAVKACTSPESPDHMTYEAGEYLEVLAQLDSDWLFCANGRREGLVRISDISPVSDSALFDQLHNDFYN